MRLATLVVVNRSFAVDSAPVARKLLSFRQMSAYSKAFVRCRRGVE